MNLYLIQKEDKTLKMKKLKKVVLESLVGSGITRDKSDVNEEIELKVSLISHYAYLKDTTISFFLFERFSLFSGVFFLTGELELQIHC